MIVVIVLLRLKNFNINKYYLDMKDMKEEVFKEKENISVTII